MFKLKSIVKGLLFVGAFALGAYAGIRDGRIENKREEEKDDIDVGGVTEDEEIVEVSMVEDIKMIAKEAAAFLDSHRFAVCYVSFLATFYFAIIKFNPVTNFDIHIIDRDEEVRDQYTM